MMDYTSKMLALLGRLRREMHGEVSVAMCYYGKSYGLNYGVSLHTLRSIAREEVQNYEFAKYLFKQDVRELRLSALTIAEPEYIVIDDLNSWSGGIVNSEIAEEAAQQLFSKVEPTLLRQIFKLWIASESALLVYCALLSASRSSGVEQVVEVSDILDIVERHPDHRLLAKGVVNLLVALSSRGAEHKIAVKEVLKALPSSASTDYIIEEIEWQI